METTNNIPKIITSTDRLDIVHFGGESKEVIEAEDRWHDEQKRLEEFKAKLWELGLTASSPKITNLDKTIKNEDKFVSQGCKVCNCGKRSESKGGQGGNGACGCSCHSTWNL